MMAYTHAQRQAQLRRMMEEKPGTVADLTQVPRSCVQMSQVRGLVSQQWTKRERSSRLLWAPAECIQMTSAQPHRDYSKAGAAAVLPPQTPQLNNLLAVAVSRASVRHPPVLPSNAMNPPGFARQARLKLLPNLVACRVRTLTSRHSSISLLSSSKTPRLVPPFLPKPTITMSSSSFNNTDTGSKPADPYTAKNLQDPDLKTKVTDLVNFADKQKFCMMTTVAPNGLLASRCMALAGKVRGRIPI